MKIAHSIKRGGEARKTPSYKSIATDLRTKVVDGLMAPGLMLPGRRDLAAEYGVSVPTIGRAVAALVADGTLRADLRRGTFVGTPTRDDRTNAVDGSADSRTLGGARGVLHAARPLLPATPDLDAGLSLKVEGRPGTFPASGRTAVRGGSVDVRIGIAAWLPVVSSESASESHYSEVMVSAIERATSRFGGRSHFHNLWRPDGQHRPPAEGYEALVRGNVDVALLVHLFHADSFPDLYNAVETLRIPAIVINDDPVNPPLSSVYYDHAGAAYQAAKHLYKEGCTDVVFFSARSAPWVEGRWQGALRAASDIRRDESSAIGRIDRSVVESDTIDFGADQGGYDYARRIIEAEGDGLLNGQRGIIAANDAMALGFIRAASELGFVLQRDYVIIGFDDQSEARQSGLSSMRPPFEEMGREMVRLARQIVEEYAGPRRVCLHSQLVSRASSRFDSAI